MTGRQRGQEVGLQEGVGMDGKPPPQGIPAGVSAIVQRVKRNRKINMPVVTAGNSGTTLTVSSSSSGGDSGSGSSTTAGTNGNRGDGGNTGVSKRMEDVIKYPLSGSASPPF